MEDNLIPHIIKIKYNNSCINETDCWIVNIDEKEHFFSNIEINVFSKTSKDSIEFGENNYISCSGWIQINDTGLIINPFPTKEDTVL